MKTPIIFFSSFLFGLNTETVQGSSIQYEHDMGFRSIGKYLKVFWSDGEGYELTYNKIRFEFDSTGKLTQTLFGANKYELGATSEPCNVPEGVDYTGGVVETRGSDKNSYTCSQCEAVVEEACGDGIKQICDYMAGVVDNPPFNNWAVNSFFTMCKQFYAACEVGRVQSECNIKCSASDPPTLKAEVCMVVPTPSPVAMTSPPVALPPLVTTGSVWQDGTNKGEKVTTSTLVDGNILIVAGDTYGDVGGTGNMGDSDPFAIGIDLDSGLNMWEWQAGTASDDFITTSLVIDSETIVLAGHSDGNFAFNNYGQSDMIAVGLDMFGVQLWRWQDGTNLVDAIQSSVLVDSNTVIFSGSTGGNFAGSNKGSSDFMVVAVRISEQPFTLWKWQDGTSGSEQFKESTLIDSNTVVLSGSTNGDFEGNNKGSNDFVAVCLDISGPIPVVVWKWQDGTTKNDQIRASTLVDSNTLVLSGYTYGDFGGDGNSGGVNDPVHDVVSIAINPNNGMELWRLQESGPGSVETSILLDSNTLVISGSTSGDFDGNGNKGYGSDVFSMGVDMSSGVGVTSWKYQEGSDGPDTCMTSVAIDSNTFIVSGGTDSGNLDGNGSGRNLVSITVDVE